jgi:hypothetical protein
VTQGFKHAQFTKPDVAGQWQKSIVKSNHFVMSEMGKVLVIAGLMMTAVGLILWSGFGRGWVGRLPGDIHYSRGNFSFYFPVITCLLASLVLTLLLWLFRK